MSGPGWIPCIGGCGPMWSRGRSPGTWRRPHSCSLWRGVARYRSRRDAIPTTYLPTDAVPTAKTQGRTGPLQTNLWAYRKHHAPRRARFSPPRGRRRGCPARSGAPGWSGPSTRSESTASGSPTAKACRALPAVHSGHTPPQPQAQQHPGQLITALGCERAGFRNAIVRTERSRSFRRA
jgi:hypothetical protein